MGVARLLRIAVASALFCTAMARAECLSVLRESSSGVFNRISTGVAWSGTLLGVAKVDGAGSREITFATYTEDLVPLTSDRVVAASSFDGVTALLWNGRDFGVFYEDSTGQLVLQRVSTSGALVGSAVAVAPNHQASTQREYDVAWDDSGQQYVVAHSVTIGDKGLWLTFLNRDGSVRNEIVVTTLVTPPFQPRVAVNGAGGVGVIFRRNGAFSVRVFDAAGSGSVTEPLGSGRDAVIAGDGSSFAFVGNSPISAPKELDWAIIDAQGKIVSGPSKMFARGEEIQPVSLMWNASRSEWALAYLSSLFPFSQVRGDYRLRRFTASGDLISDGAFSPDPLLVRLATSLPFTWTGSSYVSAAGRAASGSLLPYSYLVRNCPLTAEIGVTAPAVRAGTSVTFTAKVDGGAGGNTYAWDFGDGRSSSEPAVAVRFDRLGEYSVVLRVTDSAGATSVSTMKLSIVMPRRRAVNH